MKPYPCAICNSWNTIHLKTVKGFSIVKCAQCSFIYVNPRLSNEEIFDLYTGDYFQSSDPAGGYDDYDEMASLRIRTFEEWYLAIKPFLSKVPGRALDVGCASGYFLDVLKEENWETYGIEPNAEMLKKAAQKGHIVTNAPLTNYTTSNKFDLITLFETLEHLPKLHLNMEMIASLIAEGGVLAVAVPDFNCLQRKLLGGKWFQFKPREHIYYFTKQTLCKLVGPYGFELVSCKRAMHLVDTRFILDRLGRYGFTRLKRAARFFTERLGLGNKPWHLHSGCLFAVFKTPSRGAY